jgi:cytochrome c-type biogenesis protein CcmE
MGWRKRPPVPAGRRRIDVLGSPRRERARISHGMDPSRKRAVRLTVALTVAVLLASALIYTSFSAGRDELTASQLINRAKPHTEYILAGTVIHSQRTASTLYFRVRDPKRDISVPVSYQGSIPGPFATGRGVLVSVHQTASGVYQGQPGSLTTKCPSKYQAAAAGSSSN